MEKMNQKKNYKSVEKSLKDGLTSFFLAVSTLFGTKKKVDRLNKESIEKVRKGKKQEELTIFLHGYVANYYRSMYSTIRWFKKRKVNVVSIGYDYREPTRKSAREVKTEIDKIMRQANVKKINLVGISLGGLIARYYAEKCSGHRVIDRLVTVYAPLKPVPEEDFGFKLHLFLRNNPHLANEGIREIEGRYSVKNYLAIYGLDDKLIRSECTRSRKVKQVGVRGGHIFVSYNPAVMRITLDYLKRGKILEGKLD